MSTILIIAYQFYPLNTGGSHRPFRIAKFLKERGHHPIVITSEESFKSDQIDPSLLKKLDQESLIVHQIPVEKEDFYSRISEKYYLNIVDDTYKRWKKNLLNFLEENYKGTEVDRVLITAPPFSILKAVEDVKRLLHVPVWVDMRDAWSQWNVFPYASKLHYTLTLRLERKVLSIADKVLVTSKVTKDDFLELHPDLEKGKMLYVPNSFDTFESEEGVNTVESKALGFNIGYVGSFYYSPASEELVQKKWYKKKIYQWLQYTPEKEYWKYRSPHYFFKCIQLLLTESPALEAKLCINLAGNVPGWLEEMIKEFNLGRVVKFHGKISKEEVIAFQKSQDVLLITSSKKEIKKDYSIAGKTFEYFSLLKPILAFVTEGAQKDILEPSNLALIFNPDKIEENKDRLKKMIEKGVTVHPNKEYIAQFLTSKVLEPLEKSE